MKNKNILIIGDIVALAIVTIVGFVTHGEGSVEYLPRMAAAYFPLVAAWLILALVGHSVWQMRRKSACDKDAATEFPLTG